MLNFFAIFRPKFANHRNLKLCWNQIRALFIFSLCFITQAENLHLHFEQSLFFILITLTVFASFMAILSILPTSFIFSTYEK